ncbi:dTDP-4-dehydrorhamnose reductase [Aphanothece hegewaldii CCALA 016]|uniref:dTDP-4-dehydrorhamnose reductase n=1 Tax=Aphanothece hegewaldii CCALA 016 TaxID=2107694 RepID=A0A2T1M138_9CHRO|nr:dTDP-4-dehydrorhamnose reductase [Aphanothece hegewaldii]PSF38408.1 dTDP-4-dehydrorhamnose reductase [Aphanothece hegewaldii CCALA 016]
MTRILLIGSQGQVGQELQLILPQIGEVIGVGRDRLDLSDGEKLRQIIIEAKPDYLVNAAAYTAVDKAESELELANAINGIAPQIMATEAKKMGATFLHISTDYVFDGQKNTPYLETDSTNPLGAYGSSKLLGENAIQEVGGNSIILRTAWVYGTSGKGNFVKTMLRVGKEREQLKVVVDQVGSPTWAKDIADAIAKLLTSKTAPGIYHFTNSGVVSWYDFAEAIFSEARQIGFPLCVKEVFPITTDQYPTPAKRPAYSVLSGQKITPLLGTYPPYWRDSLKQMLKQLYR